VHGAKEQPEWPQVLEAEHEHEVGNHYDGPKDQKLHVQNCCAANGWGEKGLEIVD